MNAEREPQGLCPATVVSHLAMTSTVLCNKQPPNAMTTTASITHLACQRGSDAKGEFSWAASLEFVGQEFWREYLLLGSLWLLIELHSEKQRTNPDKVLCVYFQKCLVDHA